MDHKGSHYEAIRSDWKPERKQLLKFKRIAENSQQVP